jgi:DNA primase
LSWLGVADRDIELLNLESMRHRSVYGIIEDRQRTFEALQGIAFEERELPIAAEFVEPDSEYADYLRKRCVPMDFPFMATCQSFHQPGVSAARRGIIVPFTYHDQVVGWTTRFLDDRNPRYLSDTQPGYVFNVDSIKDSWTQVIVTEGIFDALSIGGVAVMHNDINDAQARLIRNLGKEITVVPDQDKTGLDLIDRAMELGWAVSIPDWGDCKDVNDAVIKHGRLATLITIMQSRETSRIKIELRKRQLAKRLFN